LWATEDGHGAIMRLLVEKSAEPEVKDGGSRKSCHLFQYLLPPPTEESCSSSPNLSDGSHGSSLENPEGQSFTPKGAKCKPEVTKYNKAFNCCSAPDCRRNECFASLTILRRHETEIHGMHNKTQNLQCPIPAYERHNRKGFRRNEQLENHIRRKHPNYNDNIGYCQKRKVDVDWDEGSSRQKVYLLKAASSGIVNASHYLEMLELKDIGTQGKKPALIGDHGMVREWLQVAETDGFGKSMLPLAKVYRAVGQVEERIKWLEKAKGVTEIRDQAIALRRR